MEIIKNQKNYGNAQDDKQFFKDNYDKIKPLKQITVDNNKCFYNIDKRIGNSSIITPKIEMLSKI